MQKGTTRQQMVTIRHPYKPDYAPPPGKLLEEYLETYDISARELARRCGRSPKLITEILSGKAALEPETALQLEHVLKTDATIWLNLEAEYRLHLARLAEELRLSEDLAWAQQFPLRELEKRGILKSPKDAADTVRQLLQFFGAGGVEACRERFSGMASIAYRHSPSFKTAEKSLHVWLRLGEIKANQIPSENYDRNGFIEALRKIRTFTVRPQTEFMPAIEDMCARAGVAFAVIAPLEQMALSGISRWLSPRKGLIQQTLRHRSNDHFWFTFFHEAAHLLLHSRKSLFIDGLDVGSGDAEPYEEEANVWAASFLISPPAMERFCSKSSFKEPDVIQFAKEQDVAPGIVVGQLQKRELIAYSRLNNLKSRVD
jgi:HTH-type transcriptional regulator/antitoxin HigA